MLISPYRLICAIYDLWTLTHFLLDYELQSKCVNVVNSQTVVWDGNNKTPYLFGSSIRRELHLKPGPELDDLHGVHCS